MAKQHKLWKRLGSIFLGLFLLLVCGGCAHGPTRDLWRAGDRLDPEIVHIIAEVAREQDNLHDLRAQGTCIVSSRELVGRRRFNVTLLYHAPNDVVVRGFDPTGLAGQAFRLIAVEGALDVEIPEISPELAKLIAEIPADSIAQELLRPEDWEEITARTIRVVEKDLIGDHKRLTLLINKRFGFFRRITLEGPDWVLRRSELLDRHGHVLVRVEWPEYLRIEGVLVPVEFEAAFPLEQLSMRFVLNTSKVTPNTGLTRAALVS